MAATADPYANLARLRAPGVHIEERAPARPPVFRTGVPVFVGFVDDIESGSEAAASDNANAGILTRPEQFTELVGRAAAGSFLAYAVRGFFENGGERCVVIPLREVEDRVDALTTLFRPGGRLEDLEDIDLVCVPDIVMAALRQPRELVFELQSHVLDYCKRMGDRFAILDALPMLDTELEDAIEHWQTLLPTEGALYFPWIYVDPVPEPGQRATGRVTNRRGVRVPPCGHVAGIYARTDATIGVHKAPANELVEGALDVEILLTDVEQARLNSVGVNCLRSFPGRGIRVWGARTLSGQPPWRYVNVRRLFLTLVRWIEHAMNDVVFEPHAPPLWDRVSDRLGAYCYELFQRGALQGGGPEEAFFIKCDAETNPIDVRMAGQLVCDIGLAIVRPAEFIVVRITQSTAGTTAALAAGA